MKHFPPPTHEAPEPGGRRLDLRHWLIIVASLLAALVVPFLLVLLLDQR